MCLQVFHGSFPTSADGIWGEVVQYWQCLSSWLLWTRSRHIRGSVWWSKTAGMPGWTAGWASHQSQLCMSDSVLYNDICFSRTLKLNYFEIKLRELPVSVLHSNAFPVFGLLVHVNLCLFFTKHGFCWSFFMHFQDSDSQERRHRK